MSYLVITKTGPDNRIEKQQPCATLERATAFLSTIVNTYPTAFIVEDLGVNTRHLLVDPVNRTVSISHVPKTAQQTNAPILRQITNKEASCMRAIRDCIRGNGNLQDGTGITPKQRLDAIEAEIANLRGSLQ